MKFRIWFNRDSKIPEERWVIAPEHAKQILVSGVFIRTFSETRADISSCPQAWIECTGEITMQGSLAWIENTDNF
jgi:hypothetical protein